MKSIRCFGNKFKIKITDIETGEVKRLDIDNQLMAINAMAYLNMLAGQTSGMTLGDLQIRYLAVGTDGTPADPEQTGLFAEIFRCPFEDQGITGNYTLNTLFRLDTTDGNGLIQEMGIFGGPAATITPNSGTLLSRITLYETKSENKIWDIDRIDSVALGTSAVDWIK